MKHIIHLLCGIAIAFALSACKDSSEKKPTDPVSQIMSLPKAKDEPLGNFIVVNQADEPIFISSSPTFSSDSEIKLKFDGLSLTLNLNKYFSAQNKLIKLYALKESELTRFAEDSVKPVASSAILVSEGGTFSPYGSNRNFNKFGEMRVCNKTGKVLAYTYNDVVGPIEGMIGRTSCNFPIDLPAKGLLDLYFLDAETLALEDTWSDIVADGSLFRLDLGEGYQNQKPATVVVRSRIATNVQIVDGENQTVLNNLECDLCPYLPQRTTGTFEINANADYTIEVRDLSGNLLARYDEIVLLGNNGELVLDLSMQNGMFTLSKVEPTESTADVVNFLPSDILIFNVYCRTDYNADYDNFINCTINYRGDEFFTNSIHYEFIDTDGRQYYLEDVTSEYTFREPVNSLYGKASLRLLVEAVDGVRYESPWLDFTIWPIH